MVSVSFRNWCAVFCLLFFSLYYVNAFRLIQTDAKPERHVTTDVKELVKKITVLKDEVISHKDTYSDELSDEISIDIDVEDDDEEDEEHYEEEDHDSEISEVTVTEEDDDDDENKPKIVSKILPASAKKLAKEDDNKKEKNIEKAKPVIKIVSKKFIKEETEEADDVDDEDDDDEEEIEEKQKIVTKILPASVKKLAKEDDKKQKMEEKTKTVAKISPKKVFNEETEEDEDENEDNDDEDDDDEEEIKEKQKMVTKILPASVKKMAKEDDRKSKIEEKTKPVAKILPKKVFKKETEEDEDDDDKDDDEEDDDQDDDDEEIIKEKPKIATKILPASVKKLANEGDEKKPKLEEKAKPITKILPKKVIKEETEEDDDDEHESIDKPKIVTKILPASVKKLTGIDDKKNKIEHMAKSVTKIVPKKIIKAETEEEDSEDDDINGLENEESDDDEKPVTIIVPVKKVSKVDKIEEKPKVVAKILPASAKKLAKVDDKNMNIEEKPVIKTVLAKKVIKEEIKIVEKPLTKIVSKKIIVEESEENNDDDVDNETIEESEENPKPVKKKPQKKIKQGNEPEEEIVETTSWFWSSKKEVKKEDDNDEVVEESSWFWSSAKEPEIEDNTEDIVESTSWFWSSTKETEKEDDNEVIESKWFWSQTKEPVIKDDKGEVKEEAVESKSWFWSTKEVEKEENKKSVEEKSWFWSSTKEAEKEDSTDEKVEGKSWFWSSKNEADDDVKDEEQSWLSSVTNILPALPFGIIPEEVETVKEKPAISKSITKKPDKIKDAVKPVVKSEITVKKVEPAKVNPKVETPKVKQPELPKDKKPPPKVETKIKLSETIPVVKPVEVKQVQKKIVKPSEFISDEDDDALYFHLPSFSPNFDVIENEECKKQGDLFLDQLNKHKLWALKMLDASAKIPSGILKGNLNQFGDYDQCLSIFAKIPVEENPDADEIKIGGKYCLASIDIEAQIHEMKLAVHLAQGRNMIRSKSRDPGHFIPRFSTVRWGLCIPSGCTSEDAEKILEESIRKYNESATVALNFDVNVESGQCSVRKAPKKILDYHPATIATIVLVASIAIIVFISTVRDFRPIEDEEPTGEIAISKLEQVLMSFSLKRTVKSLLKREPEPDEIECIHGVRALGTFALYIAHKLIPIGHLPFTNKVSLTEISNNPMSAILRLSVIYTDSFLLLSGVLTSYRMSKDMETKGSIPWFGRMVARFIRLTPSLLFVLLYYAYVMEYVGEGPLWNTIVTPNADLCKYNWWKNIFYIQNLFPFEDMCANHTHQLALDMQLSLIAPIFVWLLYKRPLLGVTTTIVCHAISVILRYYSTINYRLSIVIYHGISVSQLYRTANMLYASSIHRATPYLAGVGLGVLLRQITPNFLMHKILLVFGWVTAGYFTLWALYSPSHLSSRTYLYDLTEAAQFSALCSLAWAMALSWLIFACHADSEGPLNMFLSSRPMVLFSRISYTMYLTQFIVFFYNVGSLKTPTEFHMSSSLDLVELFIVILVAILLTLLVDLPVQKIKSILLRPSPKPELTSEPEEPLEDTENPIENHKSSEHQTSNNKLRDTKQLSLSQDSVSQRSDDQNLVESNILSDKHHQLSLSQDSDSQLSDTEDHNTNNVRIKKVQWNVTQQMSEESVDGQLSDTEDNSLNLQPPKNKFTQQLSEESIGSQLSDTEDNSMSLDVPRNKWTEQESLESVGSQFSEDEESINLESPINRFAQNKSLDVISSPFGEEDNSDNVVTKSKFTQQESQESVSSQLSELEDKSSFWTQQDEDDLICLQPQSKFIQQESQESVDNQSGDNEDESTDSSTPKSSKWTVTQQASQESVSQLSEDEAHPGPINPPIKPPRIRWSVSKQSSDEELIGSQLSDSEDQGEVVVQSIKIKLKAAQKVSEESQLSNIEPLEPVVSQELSETRHLSGSQESVNSQKSDWMLTESLSESLHLSGSHESINAEELLED